MEKKPVIAEGVIDSCLAKYSESEDLEEFVHEAVEQRLEEIAELSEIWRNDN